MPTPQEIHLPDQSPQSHELVDKLALTGQALQDFDSASIVFSDDVSHQYDADIAHVSRSRVQAGLQPIHPPEYFFDALTQQRIAANQYPVEYEATLLRAEMEGVAVGLEALSEQTSDTMYLELALIAARQGADPQTIAQAFVENHRHGNLSNLSRIAEVERKLGIDPKPMLDLERTKEASWQQDHRSYMLATAYAESGYPNEALELAKSVQFSSQGLAAHAKTELYGLIAVAQAKNGIDPNEMIDSTITAADKIPQHDGSYSPAWRVAVVFARLAQAEKLTGSDYQDMMTIAFDTALLDSTNLRINTYIDIARIQIEMGEDPSATLEFALQWAKQLIADSDEEEREIGIPLITDDCEDIVSLHIQLGQFDKARNILNQMFTHPDNANEKARLFGQLAAAEVKSGISFDEIKRLETDQVAEVLAGDNEQAKVALRYLGI